MNYYVRYFDDEVLVKSMKEAFDFLMSLPDIEMDEECVTQVQEYFTTEQKGPRKFFMQNHKSFIIIKTNTNNLEDFKINNAKNTDESKASVTPKATDVEQYGWYECSITISRMVTNPETGKSFYTPDTMEAKVLAYSARDAYERVVKKVHENPDIDQRSQIPSITNKSFQYTFIG